MAQILCWNYAYQAPERPENYVLTESREKILAYLTPASVIVFTEDTLAQKDNMVFLISIKLALPQTVLVFVNGTDRYPQFCPVAEADLPQFFKQCEVRQFSVEDKKKSILDAVTTLMQC